MTAVYHQRSPRAIPLSGLVFGELTVLERVNGPYGVPTWRCRCSCGREHKASSNALRNQGTTRCIACARARLAAMRPPPKPYVSVRTVRDCVVCGKHDIGKAHKYCSRTCKNRADNAGSERRRKVAQAEAKANGWCVKCYKLDAAKGRLSCRPCLDKSRAYQAKRKAEQATNYAEAAE